MSRLIVDYTPAGREYLIEECGELIHRHEFDEAVYLDAIKAMDPNACWTPSKDMKLVASIPIDVFNYWQAQHGVNLLQKDNLPLLKRLLNDPDNKFLRTDGGSRL